MGNCLTACIKTADDRTDGGEHSSTSSSAPRSAADKRKAAAAAAAAGIEVGDGYRVVAASPLGDHMPERSERDGLLSQSPQHFTSVGASSGGDSAKTPEPLAGGGAMDAPNNGAHKDQQPVSDNALNSLFESYKDAAEDAILADGIERLCADLDYRPDDFAILVLAWRLDASQMCRFTRAEFIHGLRRMQADTIEAVRRRLEAQVAELRRPEAADQFKQLYRFAFLFGLEPGFRIVGLEMAVCLWRLVFTVNTPAILDRWLYFLEQHPNIRGVPKDTWNMFLNFAETVDITQYDDTEAWPSLFDDFVEYETDRTNQNETAKAEGAATATASSGEVGVNVL